MQKANNNSSNKYAVTGTFSTLNSVKETASFKYFSSNSFLKPQYFQHYTPPHCPKCILSYKYMGRYFQTLHEVYTAKILGMYIN